MRCGGRRSLGLLAGFYILQKWALQDNDGFRVMKLMMEFHVFASLISLVHCIYNFLLYCNLLRLFDFINLGQLLFTASSFLPFTFIPTKWQTRSSSQTRSTRLLFLLSCFVSLGRVPRSVQKLRA